jgi:hypothetical protein
VPRTIAYQAEQVDAQAEGNVPICRSQPEGDVVMEL